MKKIMILLIIIIYCLLTLACKDKTLIKYNQKYKGEEGYINSLAIVNDESKNNEEIIFYKDGSCEINIITNQKCTDCTYEINEKDKTINIKHKKNNIDEELKLDIMSNKKLKATEKITSGVKWPNWVKDVDGYPSYTINNQTKKENKEIIIVDNYMGKNASEVKQLLEEKGLNVIISFQEVYDMNSYQFGTDTITNQSFIYYPLKKGDTITLYTHKLSNE